MTTLQFVLSTLIRSGKVTVETPDLDMDDLCRAVENRAEDMLRQVRGVVYEEEMTDKEKVVWLQEYLSL